MTKITAGPGQSVNIDGAAFGPTESVAAYERSEPIKPVLIRMICSVCQGEYVPTGKPCFDPSLHEHQCNGCAKVSLLEGAYPKIRWEAV